MTAHENFITRTKQPEPVQAIRAMDVRIIKLLSEGYQAKEVAEQLKMKHRTVTSRVEDIRIMWKCRNTTHLVVMAINEGLV